MLAGSSNSDFGLPEPETTDTELARECNRYRPSDGSVPNVERQKLLDEFNTRYVPALNAAAASEQRALFHHIVDTVMNGGSLQAYVGGKSGRGKTWLINAVTAYLRLHGKVVLVCASTGIAAINHVGGMTAHALFKIPVVDGVECAGAAIACGIESGTQRAELLAHVDLIVWVSVRGLPGGH